MSTQDLAATARALAAPGKGILAADESSGTIEKRLTPSTSSRPRRTAAAYRELLFTTDGMGEFISGVILYDETSASAVSTAPRSPRCSPLRASSRESRSTTAPSRWPGSTVRRSPRASTACATDWPSTIELGAPFTKWRAVIAIGDGIPTRGCIDANAEALARFAALSQEAGLVPSSSPRC